jgi:uracil-DNA glycosylase family 4
MRDSAARVAAEIAACKACPELRRYCAAVARTKRRAYTDWTYWGKPVPSFGDPKGRLMIIGLAPAAHGGNRTGRIFTGDASGDFLFRALHRAGFASQPTSTHRDDGLRLRDAYITAILHCAPPGNKPTARQIQHCRRYLLRERAVLKQTRAVLVLGRLAMEGYLAALKAAGIRLPKKPAFAHGASYDLGPGLPRLYCAYHPSQQNTFTGRLTEAMFDRVLRAVRLSLR